MHVRHKSGVAGTPERINAWMGEGSRINKGEGAV